MVDLLKAFSWEQIVLFTVLFALAIKGLISFIDWVKERNSKAFKVAQKPIELQNMLQKHDEEIKDLHSSIDSLLQKIDLLIQSDKDDIKAFITREHHYFCYQKKWIDDYSLDCIEKRFDHYQDEGGNSFVETFMNELRSLPKKQPDGQEEVKE